MENLHNTKSINEHALSSTWYKFKLSLATTPCKSQKPFYLLLAMTMTNYKLYLL